jgi:glutathione S-transferase
MTLPTPITLMGAPGSPYTRKMRAVLRYRHIPYRLLLQFSPETANRPQPKVPLLPTFYLPDENGKEVAVTDSTPLIRRFEAEFSGRSVVPADPVLAFLDLLLEDYGDEWLTKCMYHYRWYYEADAKKASSVIPHWARVDVTDEQIAPLQKGVKERQISRLWVVGSNDTTAPVIEASYRRFLRLFDAHLQTSRFLLGRRPASGDFGIYGQLTCLALFDPTPAAVTIEASPRIYAWVEALEDLSGLEPSDDDWTSREAIPETLKAVLSEVGRVYAPFLLANDEALEKGAEQMETRIDGQPWVQTPFPYQRKCLRWLREAHAALEADDRAALDAVLAGTGCEALFA